MSASSKLRMRSTNEGTDPVVMDLSFGIVTVGDLALAVKGIALPSRMRLEIVRESCYTKERNLPLRIFKSRSFGINKVAMIPLLICCKKCLPGGDLPSQRVDNHEDELVKGSVRRAPIFESFILCKARKERLVREETNRKHYNRNRY